MTLSGKSLRVKDQELKVEQSDCMAGNNVVTAANMTAHQREEETIKSCFLL